ncbi:hypothetical protein [Levilactobacillus yonginensis]|uniref:hypothetical protein n=1 Tax=Levilactobacillus yonginensis TaxID=1054041 RepID=UPI00345D4CC4
MEKARGKVEYIRSIIDEVKFRRDNFKGNQIIVRERNSIGQNKEQNTLRFSLKCEISSKGQEQPFFEVEIHSFFKADFMFGLSSKEIQEAIWDDEALKNGIANPTADWLLNVFSNTTSWGLGRPISLNRSDLTKGLFIKSSKASD